MMFGKLGKPNGVKWCLSMGKFTDNRDITIDVLRSMCLVWIVFFWHNPLRQNIAFSKGCFTLLWMATTTVLAMFFFISGYLLSTRNDFNSLNAIKSFYMNRVLRIYPLFAVAVFTYPMNIPLKCKLLTVVGVSTFMPPSMPTLWFVSMLLGFYLITPVLCSVGRITFIFIIVAVMALFCLWHLTCHKMDERFLAYFPYYCLGLYLGKEKLSITELLSGTSFRLLIFCFSLSLLIVVAFVSVFKFSFNGASLIEILSHIWLPFSVASLYIFAEMCRRLMRSKLLYYVYRILVYSGLTMYLFHRHIYCIVCKIFSQGNNCCCFVVLSFVSVITISYLLQRTYDSLLKSVRY